jgi:GNAT superfamily N-acetyltransferase
LVTIGVEAVAYSVSRPPRFYRDYRTLLHLPIADINCVIVAGGSDAEKRLREFHRIIATAELPAIIMLAGPVAARLGQVARELGLTAAGTAPLMMHLPRQSPHASGDYIVERVTDAAGFEAALEICIKAFGFSDDSVRHVFGPAMLDIPGCDYFLARRGDQARTSVMTIRHGRFVGIYSMATPTEYQRQGAGRNLLESVIAYHLQRGATTFYLISTDKGHPLYEKIGFTTVDLPAIWVAGASTQFSS